MSVRAALTLGGYAIGGQWGGIIGGLIGGIVDPQKIQGSKLGDIPVQTAREGMPIARVYGRAPVLGTIIESGPTEKIEVEERQGKGGPVVVSERALKTFAILICKGEIAGIGRVWEDGRLVYDVSEPLPSDEADEDERAEKLKKKLAMSAKFLEDTRFYFGTNTQTPDPAIEALRGMGTTPAYRRRAYMVRERHDITDNGVRIPQYRFEVIKNGGHVATESLSPLQFGGTPTPWAVNAGLLRDPRKGGVTYQYGYNRGTVSFLVDDWRDTIDEALADAGAWIDLLGTPVLRGWVNGAPNLGNTGVNQATPFAPWDADVTPDQLSADIALVYSRKDAGAEYGRDGISSPYLGLGIFTHCDVIPDPVWARNYFQVTSGNGTRSYFRSGVVQSVPGYAGTDNDDDMVCGTGGTPQGKIAQWGDFFIVVRAIPDCGAGTENRVPIPDAEGYFYDLETRQTLVDSECEAIEGTFLQLQAYEVDDSGEGGIPSARMIVAPPLGPLMLSEDSRNNEAFWEAAYAEAVAAGTMAPGLTYPADYPVEVENACRCTAVQAAVVSDCIPLWEIQLDIAASVGLGASKLDVSQLTDCVDGFAITADVTAAEASRFLQVAYFYDLPEWDSKLRAIKRGGPVAFTITEDDLLEEDGLQETMREQAYEIPRRFHVFTFNAEFNYAEKPQTATRYSPDVQSLSEMRVKLPIVMSIDETMQIADRLKKVAMADQDGQIKLRTWLKYLFATPTDIFAFNGLRYRIDEATISDGAIEFTLATRDRQSAYTSTLTGVPPIDLTDPTPGLSGPTLFAAMNLPQLRQQDNTAGMYLAACGVYSSWPGCDVLLSTDGGVTFSQALRITQPSVMGYLTTEATDPAESPVTEEMSASVFGGSLSGAADAALEDGANVFAMIDADGVAELAQFADAVETDDGQYDLDGITRGLLETEAVAHEVGEQFVTVANVYFLPIDADFAGRVLIFRPVTVGTSVDAATDYEVLYEPPEFILDGGAP